MQHRCKQSFTIFLLATLALWGCTPDEKRVLPDVSGIDAPLEIVCFEQALFQLDTTDFAKGLAELAAAQPEFAELFSQHLIGAGSLAAMTPEQVEYLRGFVASPIYRSVYDTTQLRYPQLDDVKADLQQALRYFRYYFPDLQAPRRLTTFNAAFNYAGIIYGENELGVGLEMFLGPDFDYTRYDPGAPIFSNYLTRTYTKEHLVAALVRVLIDDLFAESPPGNRLLDEMVMRGKKLYILDQLLPTAPDTVKFRVTADQWTWLQENERNLWAHLLTENLLYSTRYADYRKLVEPSPSGAPALPEESPGESANYVGFLIVKAFMQQQPDLPLSELLLYNDTQKLLELSKYKPKRE